MSSFLEGSAATEGSGIPPSEKDVVSTEVSPLAELYFPFLFAFTSSLMLLYCSICIIRTIYKTSQLHNWHYFFIANFIACDIAFVLLKLLPGALVSLYAMFDSDFQGVSCKYVIGSSFPYIVGILILVVIAFDNVLNVVLPFKYKEVMGTKVAVVCVGCAWCIALLFFAPSITDEDTERTKSSFCKWTDSGRAFAYGIPITISTMITVPLYVYLYYVVVRSWWDVRQCTDPSVKAKLQLTFEGLRENRKLATNLLLLFVVPMIFGFLYPTVRYLSHAAGGEDFSDSPYIIYVVLPYISTASMIVRSVLFGFRLHSQVKVWTFKCLH